MINWFKKFTVCGESGTTISYSTQTQPKDFFYLDQSDNGYWLIKDRINDKRYSAGYDKQKVQDLISRLNKAHRPNVEQFDLHEIFVCWNDHDRHEKCNFVKEI